ncbi:HIT family protein [Jannaschia seohaensis]|uniref:Diadenosine tetraphosphate (Ap4A) HIT family hydrolase n=1 Tax=Jannaschia seohaensis TaxID=475081 RepID=A0A2Y9C8Y9_9RHOB|nr:HIT family protein [Jannaschia seohaensis]PWJ12945.1 diadenosine tetraphosphate (Ap4A) HIT family hydrolase [Jannaschia seohaensis]SSA50753.1 Diadenosine tetraphosphate (Ap4A) hydrolase [Jannaschia seohaensis]
MDARTRQDLDAFAEKFRTAELHLAETQGWTLSLRPGQPMLGSMVLSVRSGTRDLALLTPEEAVGMGAGLGLAERLAREVFGAVRINVLCLMMQDPIVHFHILPRYDRPVSAAGRDWTDTDWPGPPQIAGDPAEDAVLHALRDTLRAALKGDGFGMA